MFSFSEKKGAVLVGTSKDVEVLVPAACTPSKSDSADVDPKTSAQPNDSGGDSAAHHKVEADIPGYITVRKINSNKFLANTKMDIERHCKKWDEFWEEPGCEGETDLTTQLRVHKELQLKCLSGQDGTPEQLQETLNKVKFVLQSTVVVWFMEHAQHELAQLGAMDSAAD